LPRAPRRLRQLPHPGAQHRPARTPAGFRKLTVGSAGISLITPRKGTVSNQTVAELHAASTRVDGAPAIRLDARERIAGQVRQVTSTHVYVDGA
jgi:hypothetical protein